MQAIVESAPKKRGNPYRDKDGKFCSRAEAVYRVTNGKLKLIDESRINTVHDKSNGKFAKHAGTSLTGQEAHDSVPKGLYKEGTLTPEQTKEVKKYETGWSMVINDYMRSKKQGDPDYEDEAKTVDAIDSAMKDSALPKPIQTWRGMLNSKIVFGEQYNSDLTDFEWHDLGYGSTTTNRNLAKEVFTLNGKESSSPSLHGDVVMKVNVPAGVKALQLSTDTQGSKVNGPQSEITLQHGLIWKVVKDHGVSPEGIRELEVSVTPISK